MRRSILCQVESSLFESHATAAATVDAVEDLVHRWAFGEAAEFDDEVLLE